MYVVETIVSRKAEYALFFCSFSRMPWRNPRLLHPTKLHPTAPTITRQNEFDVQFDWQHEAAGAA